MIKKSYLQKILDIVIENNGKLILNDLLYKGYYDIKRITGIYCNEKYTDLGDLDYSSWNNHVYKLRKLSNCNTYNEWIFENDYSNKLYGILVFYNHNNEEVKMKHFLDIGTWRKLYNQIKKQLNEI